MFENGSPSNMKVSTRFTASLIAKNMIHDHSEKQPAKWPVIFTTLQTFGVVLWTIFFEKVFQKKGFARFPNILNNKQLHQKPCTIFLPFLQAVLEKKAHLPTRAFIGFGGNVLVRAQHMPRFLIRRVPRHDEFWKIWQANQGRQRYERFVFSKKAETTSWKGLFIIIHQSFIKNDSWSHPAKKKSLKFFGTKFIPSNSRLTISAPKIFPTSPAAIKRMPAILGCPDHSSTVSKSMSFTFFDQRCFFSFTCLYIVPELTKGWRPKLDGLKNGDSFKIWPFFVSMLDFWGVTPCFRKGTLLKDIYIWFNKKLAIVSRSLLVFCCLWEKKGRTFSLHVEQIKCEYVKVEIHLHHFLTIH